MSSILTVLICFALSAACLTNNKVEAQETTEKPKEYRFIDESGGGMYIMHDRKFDIICYHMAGIEGISCVRTY